MSDSKQCRACGKEKDAGDFYVYQGYARRQCKTCVSKKNYERWKKSWAYKTPQDSDARNAYMREYTAKNKEKVVKYRANFAEKNPEYFKNYYRKLRDEGRTKKIPTKQLSGYKNIT